MNCLVKNELKWAGPFGIAAQLCGTVFIDRLNREKALDTMKSTVEAIHRRNVSCLGSIFVALVVPHVGLIVFSVQSINVIQ